MKKPSTGVLVSVGVVALIVVAVLVLERKPVSLPTPSLTTPSTATLPSSTDELATPPPVLADRMPEFQGISRWWNTPDNKPLTPESLKGKVTIIDFWTYSCINCIRTQPVLKAWYQTYQKDGLEIVGVHTPEFAFEKDPKNVDAAIKKAGLTFPIALDATYGTWNAYKNNSWPAKYIFDRQGRLREVHIGEGDYEETEKLIRALLAEDGTVSGSMTGVDSSPNFRMIGTAETYFGYDRTERFENAVEYKPDVAVRYSEKVPSADYWSLQGSWKMEHERTIGYGDVTKATGLATHRLNFEANAYHIVLGSNDGKPKRVAVRLLDEVPEISSDMLTPDVKEDAALSEYVITVTDKRLYRILRFPNGGRHTVELRVLDPGVEFYAATFGE